jgi:type IV secretory pathway TrbD component
MRIGLIAALRRAVEGGLRAALPVAGHSVLARQAGLLRSLGVERVLCLADGPAQAIIDLQHTLEAHGIGFHALHGFAALPALVRAEDDLVIIADGLVPDPAAVQALLGGGEGGLARVVATMPADHPLAAAHPDDFERIDAADRWAGVLAMRGASVQQLADFPPDADAISLLLRLAVQAGTPRRALRAGDLSPERWLLADSAAAAARHEAALIAGAAPLLDWRAPMAALAAHAVTAVAPQGLARGRLIAGAVSAVLLFGGLLAAAFGLGTTGLVAAGLGAFAAQAALQASALAVRLHDTRAPLSRPVLPLAALDAMVALVLWCALAPPPQWQPLAALGPAVVGLARLAARGGGGALAALAGDRASLVAALAVAAAFGLLPEVTACLALGLLAALLLRPPAT